MRERRIAAIPGAIASSLLILGMLPTLTASVSAQTTSQASQPAQTAKELFLAHCASCHGPSGKGDGPAARALKTPPSDLTTLAARNGGQFPEMKVLGAITAGPRISAHGSAVMPVWGPIFREVTDAATEAEVQLKIYNLLEYIKTLQVKPK
jgi:mono/diheme cytochrome c family protein